MRNLWFVLALLLVFSKDTPAKQREPSKIIIPLWTMLLNVNDAKELPYRLRTTWDTIPNTFDHTGLSDLKLMGSAQFSEQQFKDLIVYLEKFNVTPGQLVVVDLREEPHAFLNGHAFVWYAARAWWTRSAPVSLVLETEKDRLKQLSLGQHVVLKRIEKKDESGNVVCLKDYPFTIDSLKTEEQVVTEMGAHYVRLPVTDHMRPEDKDVDQFLDLVKTLPPEASIYFHCHAGRGRTSTFMIMYDILRNPKLPLDSIVDRQVQLGSLDVRQLSGPLKRHKHPNEEFRILFIKQFYEYVNAPSGYGTISWTKWITQRYDRMGKKDEQNNPIRSTGMVASTGG